MKRVLATLALLAATLASAAPLSAVIRVQVAAAPGLTFNHVARNLLTLHTPWGEQQATFGGTPYPPDPQHYWGALLPLTLKLRVPEGVAFRPVSGQGVGPAVPVRSGGAPVYRQDCPGQRPDQAERGRRPPGAAAERADLQAHSLKSAPTASLMWVKPSRRSRRPSPAFRRAGSPGPWYTSAVYSSTRLAPARILR